MKHIFSIIAGEVGMIFALSLHSFPAQGQKISFEEIEFDFERFPEDTGSVSHVFSFKNEGNKPLILYDVVAGCGCTTPEWNNAPIPAGGSGEIKITYNAKGRPGIFQKSVRVKSNAKNGTQMLRIKGNVISNQSQNKDLYPVKQGPIAFSTSLLRFGEMNKREERTDWIELLNQSDTSFQIEVADVPEYLFVLVNPTQIKKGEKGTIFVTFFSKKCKKKGVIRGEFTLRCTGKDLPTTEHSLSVEAIL